MNKTSVQNTTSPEEHHFDENKFNKEFLKLWLFLAIFLIIGIGLNLLIRHALHR